MKRSFLYLTALTVVAILVVTFTGPGGTPVNSTEQALLLPELSKQINGVDRVEIITAGNNVVATMVKPGNSWQLVQMDGYQADWQKLRTMLADLAQARVVENKTDKPEYYARLGVEDIDAADAGGVLVKLSVAVKPINCTFKCTFSLIIK